MESVSIEGHLKEIKSFWIKEKQILSHDIIRSAETLLFVSEILGYIGFWGTLIITENLSWANGNRDLFFIWRISSSYILTLWMVIKQISLHILTVTQYHQEKLHLLTTNCFISQFSSSIASVRIKGISV